MTVQCGTRGSGWGGGGCPGYGYRDTCVAGGGTVVRVRVVLSGCYSGESLQNWSRDGSQWRITAELVPRWSTVEVTVGNTAEWVPKWWLQWETLQNGSQSGVHVETKGGLKKCEKAVEKV